MSIMAIVCGLIVAAAWLVACCILIGKISEKGARGGKIALSVILFVLCAGIFCGIHIGAGAARAALDYNAAAVEADVKTQFPNAPLVRNGVAIPELPGAIDDLESMVPDMPDFFLKNMAQGAVAKGFNMLRGKSGTIISFTDENNRVTVHSIVEAVKWEVNIIIKNIVIIATIACAAILALVLVIFIIMAAKKSKKGTED